MRCPKCGNLESKVTDTRAPADAGSIRRRRQCLACNYKFFTSEVVCQEYPTVIKRDGRKEDFSKEKIRAGLSKALKKEDGVEWKVDRILSKILSEIISKYTDEIFAETIGIIVMNLLKQEDPVAYLRFASVYKNFETADDFASEFRNMRSDNKNAKSSKK